MHMLHGDESPRVEKSVNPNQDDHMAHGETQMRSLLTICCSPDTRLAPWNTLTLRSLARPSAQATIACWLSCSMKQAPTMPIIAAVHHCQSTGSPSD
mmetsp:Transcript_21882/g.66429  ORF Transcript_21882/g.66429 Transcript_21882/m.66429 type:complete len:97 (+) Transcript_21882:673-963(+)